MKVNLDRNRGMVMSNIPASNWILDKKFFEVALVDDFGLEDFKFLVMGLPLG